jgi:predicted metal-dependent hydrolase
MENKKVSNLLRAVADLMDETTEMVVEANKNVIEKTITNSEKIVEQTVNSQKEFLDHSLKLMKKIEENDSIRAYKNKLAKTNNNLKDTLEEIQRMREQAMRDLIKDSMEVMVNPSSIVDKTTKNMKKMGEQIMEEGKIMSKSFNI